MSLFERYMRFRGYDIPGATKFLGDLSRSTREELDRRQTEAAWAIARFHHANNPLYRSKLKGPLPVRWEDLPIMGKTDYQTALGGILTDGMSAGDLYTSSTSGSSAPVHVREGQVCPRLQLGVDPPALRLARNHPVVPTGAFLRDPA